MHRHMCRSLASERAMTFRTIVALIREGALFMSVKMSELNGTKLGSAQAQKKEREKIINKMDYRAYLFCLYGLALVLFHLGPY